MIYCCLAVRILIFLRVFFLSTKSYVVHSEIVIDDFLDCEPVVLDEEGDVEGSFGGDGG